MKPTSEWIDTLPDVDFGSDPEAALTSAGEALARCAKCLEQVNSAVYFANDFYCDPCADAASEFPLQTTHGGTP